MDLRVLTRGDRNVLVRYCAAWACWRKASLFLQKHGDVYPVKDEDGKQGGFKPYPQVDIAHKLDVQLNRLEATLGLTPAARARLTVPEEPTPDETMAKYFRRFGSRS